MRKPRPLLHPLLFNLELLAVLPEPTCVPYAKESQRSRQGHLLEVTAECRFSLLHSPSCLSLVLSLSHSLSSSSSSSTPLLFSVNPLGMVHPVCKHTSSFFFFSLSCFSLLYLGLFPSFFRFSSRRLSPVYSFALFFCLHSD